MGHLAGKEEILKQLQKEASQESNWTSRARSVYEILSILFTEKEAEVGVQISLWE